MSNKPYYEQQGVAMTCRSFEEYVRMFSLEKEVLKRGPILDVAAGASSFVAEANAKGLNAIAVDPMYELDPDLMQQKGMQEIEISTSKLANLKETLDWTYYGDIDKHWAAREKSLKTFISDYRIVKSSRYNAKYVAGKLPELPFPDESFELVLCSHFLFLYGEQFDANFHKEAINELLRICRKGGKVIIYPLSTLRFEKYENISKLIDDLFDDGVEMSYVTSQLPFIPGSTEMMSLEKLPVDN